MFPARLATPLFALALLLPLAATAADPIDVDQCQIKKLNHAARYYTSAVRCVTSTDRAGRDPRACLEKAAARFQQSVDAEHTKAACFDTPDVVEDLVADQVAALLADNAPPKLIFRTSTLFSGDLGGLRGADRACAQHARAGGLKGKFVALLSTSTMNARDRVTLSPGGFMRPDGVFVAANADDLFKGTISNSINVDELGVDHGGNTETWTGSSPTGLASSSCNDWTSAESNSFGINGHSHDTDTSWMAAYTQFCNRTNVALYCVER